MVSNGYGATATHPVGEPTRSGASVRASVAMGAWSSVSTAQRAALVSASSRGSQMMCAPKNYPARSFLARGGLTPAASRLARIAKSCATKGAVMRTPSR